MGALEGMHVSLHTSHPQEFVDALYREVIDLHPGASEVDIILKVDSGFDQDDPDADPEQIDGMTILDYRVFRADDQWFGDYDGTDYVQRYKEMDAWGRSDGSDTYIFIHSHPEGMPFPSDKDMMVAQIFSSIDFARTPPTTPDERSFRTYVFGAVINRNISFPLPMPDHVIPVGDREIDMGLEVRLYAELEAKHADHPRWPELVEVTARWRALLSEMYDAREANDEVAFYAVKARMAVVAAEMKPIIDEITPPPVLPEAVQKLLDALKGIIPDADILDMAPDGKSGIIGGVVPLGELSPPPAVQPVNDNFAESMDAMRKLIEEKRKGAADPTGDVILPPSDRPDVPDIFHWVD